MYSIEGGVEAGVSLGDLSRFIVLRHLWEGVPVLVQLSRDVIPPDGEVFLDRTTEVGTVWCWLRHDLVEHFRGTLPVRCLDS